jgi:type I restriction enzyme, S subunit
LRKTSKKELPVGWVLESLSNVLPISYGKGLSKENRDSKGSIPVYGSSGQVGWHTQALTNGETIIIGRKGAAGSVNYSSIPCWIIDTAYYAEIQNDLLSPHYVLHLLTHSHLVGLDKSTAVPSLSRDDYNTTYVPIAPLNEQRRIVAEIEKQFARLDEAVTALKRLSNDLKQYRAAVLKAACEGRLVVTEAELASREGRVYQSASELLKRILAERRAKWEANQLAKMKAQGKEPKDDKWKATYIESQEPQTSNLPKLPEGWTWASVEQLAAAESNSITDGPFGSNLKTRHYTQSGPRVIRLQNIGNGIFVDELAHISETHYAKLSKHKIESGDIVIAGLGENLPRSCIIPVSVGAAIVKQIVFVSNRMKT